MRKRISRIQEAAYQRDWYHQMKGVTAPRRRRNKRRLRQQRKALLRTMKAERGCDCTNPVCGHAGRCGYNLPAALQFHHRDHHTKVFDISSRMHTVRFALVLAEIEKCDVLCANCHAVETDARQYYRGQKPRDAQPMLPEIVQETLFDGL